MKGQAATEYIVMFGILLAILTPIFIYALDVSSINVRTVKSREAASTMATAADRLYNFGGGKTYVDIDLPSGVVGYSISGKTIKILTKVGDNAGEALGITRGNVTGSISIREGLQRVYLEYLDNGIINISSVG
jgi:hypothetical protein